MKKFLPSILAIAFLAMSTAAFAEKPKIIAAKFHADWCASCKAIDPAYLEVQDKFAGNKDVAFITLDKTDDNKTANSQVLAAALGFEPLFKEHAKTGFVLLVDANTGKKMGKLTKAHSAGDMEQIINQVIKGEMYVEKAPAKEKKGSGYEKKGSY